MIYVLEHTTIILLSLLLGMASLPLSADAQQPLDINYSFTGQWRFGAPVFVREEFPRFEQMEPALYQGEIIPRGVLVLSAPGISEDGGAGNSIVVRSGSVDISGKLSVAGAQYRDPAGSVRWVEAGELPALKVWYEPESPEEIRFPGNTNCVLLYQLGEGNPGEWPEGYWSVSLRLDLSDLNVWLHPAGAGGAEDPSRSPGKAIIYSVSFLSKKMNTGSDRQNLLYFQFLDARSSSDSLRIAKEALPAIGELIQAFPNDPQLLFERAQLLTVLERYEEAVDDGNRILEISRTGNMRRPFSPPFSGRGMTNDDKIQWLQVHISGWRSLAEQKELEKSQD
jgi:hypothetical protein